MVHPWLWESQSVFLEQKNSWSEFVQKKYCQDLFRMFFVIRIVLPTGKLGEDDLF